MATERRKPGSRPPEPATETTAQPGERDQPLTVDALVRVCALLLEEQVGAVWVEGEVSNLRIPASGHIYFALKDEAAQLPAVMWRSAAARLKFKLTDGARVLVRGRPGIYPEQGKFQLYVDALEPAGLGAQALALAQLRQRLADEGLFAEARKRALPTLPRRIGVVTSPTGAAVRDVIRTIERRYPVPILISPCRVQGVEAPAEIVRALERIARVSDVDVVIVGRGGGSAEDLSAFDDERVVRAIAACRVPVISAVGHEVDVTLSDLVADVRAATPTAAAELAVPERQVLRRELAKATSRLALVMRMVMERSRATLVRVEAKLVSPSQRVARGRQRLDELGFRLEATARAGLSVRRRTFERLAGRLDALSPLRVLERGYAIARTEAGAIVTRASDVATGERLALRLAEGELDVRVEQSRASE